MTRTNPEYWFLPATQSTSGNEVTALVDGEAYMTHLADRLDVMHAGDHLHLAGWRVTPTQPLRPAQPGAPTLSEHVQQLIARGVNVRSLLWRFPIPVPLRLYDHAHDNQTFTREVQGAGGEALLDGHTHPDAFACHHQKAVVLSSGGHDWAYVGGIDLCCDRWDTSTHDGAPGRTATVHQAWHDVHSVLRGPAVQDVQLNFTQRWNEQVARQADEHPGGAPPPTLVQAPASSSGGACGSQHVQVLRTLPGGVHHFAPDGEQTIRRAYERAVERAQHYVYIEDQHFWRCGLTERLRDAAARGVQVILTLSREYRIVGLTAYHNALRAEALAVLRSRAPENVHVYHLRQAHGAADINVHSKVLIVDDCYAAIGSANIGWRSFTTDSELAVAVVDGDTRPGRMNGHRVTVTRFAHELRTRLWSEHLGVSPRDVEDPILALEVWPHGEPGAQAHHAVTHAVPRFQRRFPRLVGDWMNIKPAARAPASAPP